MNQHRWTCTAIVVLNTLLAPIVNVYAQTAPVSKTPGASTPIITPLIVTELQTDEAMPILPSDTFAPPQKIGAVTKPAPVPVVPPLTTKTFATKLATVAPSFDKVVQQKLARQAAPVFSFDAPSNSFTDKPTSDSSQGFTIKATAPELIVTSNRGVKGKITNTIVIQAEVARLPKTAPSISKIEELPNHIAFEAGTPTFIFDSERPQQIVATTIAQSGNTTIAPEPSVSIPIQRPNQPAIPQTIPNPVEPIETAPATQDKVVATQTGQASWYGLEGGPKTANGERYNPNGLTAAHRTLPFGTKVRVTSIKTGKTVTVRINDRGPFRSRRILDVSAAAAAAIGIKNDGIGDVKMEVLGVGDKG